MVSKADIFLTSIHPEISLGVLEISQDSQQLSGLTWKLH